MDGLRAVPSFSMLWASNDSSDGTKAVHPMNDEHEDESESLQENNI